MRALLYSIVQIALFLNVCFSCFVIINITDLIKYTTDTESEAPRDGTNNYYLYRALWIAICIATVIAMMVLSYYKTKILKKNNS